MEKNEGSTRWIARSEKRNRNVYAEEELGRSRLGGEN